MAVGVAFTVILAVAIAAQPVGVNVTVYAPGVLVNSETIPLAPLMFRPAGAE